MKKKLLITLGCSYTEGVGCYGDFNTPAELVFSPLSDIFSKEELEILPNQFHENGWPVRLAKKMGYDKLINMGKAGSSTSGQIKRYFEIFYKEKFEDCDVTIIWLLTQPSRISFYRNGGVSDMLTNQTNEEFRNTLNTIGLPGEYVNFIEDIDVDPILEQVFYVKCMEQHCENNSYNLLLTHAYILSDALLKHYHESKYYMTPFNFSMFSKLNNSTDFAFCGHPNELGYENLSNLMLQEIRENHPTLLYPEKESIDWKWVGEMEPRPILTPSQKRKIALPEIKNII